MRRASGHAFARHAGRTDFTATGDHHLQRTGVQSPRAAVELAQKVSKMPHLQLRGVMTYPSSLEAKPFLEETVDLFRKAGLPQMPGKFP